MKNKIKTVHFVGIGGSGMSGIAEVLLNQGFKIQGSDLNPSLITERLTSQGACVFKKHKGENVIGADVCVISSAISKSNPELKEARERGIPIVPRASMLGELMRFKQGIAIAGTHGKTTTTSMISSVLAHAGLDPTYVLGGRIQGTETGAKLGNGDYLVVEADESDRSFLNLTPVIGVITNIDNDHLISYDNSLHKLKEAFVSFVQKLPFYGPIFLSAEDTLSQELLPKLERRVITVGFIGRSDITVSNVTTDKMRSKFLVSQYGFKNIEVDLPLPGKHNVLNSLFAIGVARELGVNDSAIADGLSEYEGVERRFQFHGPFLSNSGNIFTLIDDYGHHPTEIKATICACREAFPKQEIRLIFQPHRYTRTRDLFDDFVSILSDVDSLILLDTYEAGEDQIIGADSTTLARSIRLLGKVNPLVLSFNDNPLDAIDSVIKNNEILLVMGAGSINQLTGLIIDSFEPATPKEMF